MDQVGFVSRPLIFFESLQRETHFRVEHELDVQQLLATCGKTNQFVTPSVNVTNDSTAGNPNHWSNEDWSKYNIVLQEFEKAIDIDIFNDVPEPLNHVMNSALALTLKIKSKG